jgi:hypothetical protein
MKTIRFAGTLLLALLCGALLTNAVQIAPEKSTPAPVAGNKQHFPDAADFAGEPVPLQLSDVRERFDRELLVNANLDASTLLILRRSARAFAVIEPILARNGVPDDFKYLCVIESGLLNAVSPAGAKGYWQFVEATARENGLEVTGEIDERYSLEKSTEAACRFFNNAKARFGSWTMAAAAYNAGMAGMAKQADIQQQTDYYNLLLADETSRYVFRILALKEIMRNPGLYGFDFTQNQSYPILPVRKVTVDSTVTDFTDFAKSQGINYKILKIHNPWLRDRKLSNASHKAYVIDIPTAGY